MGGCLASIREVPDSMPSPPKPGIMGHTHNPSVWAEDQKFLIYPQPHNEFKVEGQSGMLERISSKKIKGKKGREGRREGKTD